MTVASAVVLIVGFVGAPVPTAIGFTVFLAFVPGTLALQRLDLPRVLRVGLAPVIGLATLLAVATAQVWLGLWNPRGWTALLVAAALLATATHAWRRRGELRGDVRAVAVVVRRLHLDLWSVAALAVLGGWLVSVPRLRGVQDVPGGLLTVTPPVLLAALVAAVVLCAVAIASDSRGRAVTGLLLVWAILRVTTVLATDAPTYSWTYKHLGVSDVIATSGTLPQGADIYFAWPSMFAGAAWFGEATGVSQLEIARWFVPVMHLVLVGAVAALARALGLRGMQVVVAGLVVELFSWVGQDYYSPQAIALPLALGALAAALWSRHERALGWCAVAQFAVLVPTHQLTPFWVAGAIAVLAYFGRVPGRVAWPMLIWLVGFTAMNWDFVEAYGAVSSGSPLDNTGVATQAEDPDGPRSRAQALYRVAALALWLPAVAAFFAGLRRRSFDVFAAAVVAFSPFPLLVAQNYGGEAMLRVFLYSTAGMAVLVAPAVTSWLQGLHRPRRTGRVVVTVVLVAWALVGAQALYAGWFANRVSAAQVRVTSQLLDEVPGQAYFSAARGLWPTRPTAAYLERSWQRWDYDRPFDQMLPGGLPEGDDGDLAFASLEERLDAETAPTYVLFAGQTYAEAAFGSPAAEAEVVRWRDQITGSHHWTRVIVDDDVEVFRFVPTALADDPASSWRPKQH